MLQIFKLIKKKKSHRQQNMDQRGRSIDSEVHKRAA